MNKGRFPKLWSIVFRTFYYARTCNHSYSALFKMISQPSNICRKFGGPALAAIPVLFALNPFSKKDKTDKTAETLVAADALYDDAKYDELYEILNPQKEENNPEILWRLGRAIFEKSKTTTDDEKKLQLLEQSLAYVDKALEINESCFAAHKWKAILLDCVWRCKSIKGRLIQSYEIKKHILRAIELNPEDPTSYYVLGEWCYTFADLPWYQRKTASVLFATPPTSTYEEAYFYFKKAEEVKPDFYSMNWLMLAKCALKLNEKDNAIKYLQKVRTYPPKTLDDKQAHDEAMKILKKLK